MVLVEEGRISREVALKEGPQRLGSDRGPDQPVAGEHPPRVGVHDEDRMPRAVEKNRIRGLSPDAGDRQELDAEIVQGCRSHPGEATAETLPDKREEGFEPTGLHPVGPRGADQPCQLGLREGIEPSGILEESPRLQLSQGALGVRPRGVLGQDRAHGHLQAGVCGPPPLGAEARGERPVETEKTPPERVSVQPGSRANTALPPGATLHLKPSIHMRSAPA